MSTVEIHINPNVCVCVGGGKYTPSGFISDKDVCVYFEFKSFVSSSSFSSLLLLLFSSQPVVQCTRFICSLKGFRMKPTYASTT